MCIRDSIADEQHRFGVAQRAALCAKGTQPHLLLLSATPIPRTLALIVYGLSLIHIYSDSSFRRSKTFSSTVPMCSSDSFVLPRRRA